MNYCKDCNFFCRNWFVVTNSKCRHVDAIDIDGYVTGRGDKFCGVERKFGKCGPEGKNFAQREGGTK